MAKKIIKFVVLLMFFCLGNYVYAEEVNVTSEKYILYNMNDKKIIDEKNSHEETSIASLTKIMTVIVAIENINDYNQKVIITDDMLKDIAWDVAVTGFKKGEEVTYNDLLYAAILNSGADAVNALAISTKGNKDDFIKLMNDKVQELNLKNTRFANVVGLYDKNNYSSAYDMAQILMYALKNPKFKEVYETKEYNLSNGKTVKSTLSNYGKNSNLDLNYIMGAKTGYIHAAGYCLATTANIDGVEYLLITLNAHSRNKHIYDTDKIYKYFSSNYGYKNIVDKNDYVVKLKTKNAKEKEILIKSNSKIDKYLKNDFKKSDLIYEYNGIETVDVRLKKGDVLGTIKIYYNDELLDEFELKFYQTLTLSFVGFMNIYGIYILLFIFMIILIKSIINQNKKRVKK